MAGRFNDDPRIKCIGLIFFMLDRRWLPAIEVFAVAPLEGADRFVKVSKVIRIEGELVAPSILSYPLSASLLDDTKALFDQPTNKRPTETKRIESMWRSMMKSIPYLFVCACVCIPGLILFDSNRIESNGFDLISFVFVAKGQRAESRGGIPARAPNEVFGSGSLRAVGVYARR